MARWSCSWQPDDEETARTLLQQHHPRKPIIQVPKVNAAGAPFVVELPVDIERLVGGHLHLPHPLARQRTAAIFIVPLPSGILEWRVKLVGPGRAVTVAIPIVVAEQVVASRLLAPPHRERLVDRREEVFLQVGCERDNGVEVVCRVLRIEAAEKVPVWSTVSAWFAKVTTRWALDSCLQRGVEWIGGHFLLG